MIRALADWRTTGAIALAVTAAAQDPAEPPPSAENAARIAGLEQLAARGPAAVAEAPAVALSLCDPELRVRRAAVTALLSLRPDLAPLRTRLHAIVSPTAAVIADAGFQIAGGISVMLPDTGLAEYVRNLAATDAAARARAVEAVCRSGEAASAHQADVLALARDPDPGVRAAVARNVALLGWDAAVRTALAGALKDAEARVRGAAAEGLGGDRDDAEAVALLRGALQDPDAGVRAAVVSALGTSGERGRVAAADVVTTLRDRDVKVRIAALETLRRFAVDNPRAADEVLRCLAHDDPRELEGALRTAMAMQQAAARGLDRALELTKHDRYQVRRQALSTAWSIAPQDQKGRVALRLVEVLTDPDQSTVSRAEQHLGEASRVTTAEGELVEHGK